MGRKARSKDAPRIGSGYRVDVEPELVTEGSDSTAVLALDGMLMDNRKKYLGYYGLLGEGICVPQ